MPGSITRAVHFVITVGESQPGYLPGCIHADDFSHGVFGAAAGVDVGRGLQVLANGVPVDDPVADLPVGVPHGDSEIRVDHQHARQARDRPQDVVYISANPRLTGDVGHLG